MCKVNLIVDKLQDRRVTYLFLIIILIGAFVPNSLATRVSSNFLAQDTILNSRKLSADSIVKSSMTPKPKTLSSVQNNPPSIKKNVIVDSTTLVKDSTKKENSLTEIIESINKDSLLLDLRSNKLYLYKDAEVKYLKNSMKADIMEVDIETNNIFAKGTFDSLENKYRKTSFLDNQIEYKMDSIHYNMKTEKGKIYGVSFEDQEGFVHGETIKKVDETMNIKKGKYTTCDLEHPHFYLASTKAQYINDKDTKKIVIGPSYIVLEDVPIPLVIPFGFFPLMTDRTSGLIIPTLGEENIKGFYLRDGGYYQVINDYWDASLTAGIYTLGSWSVRLNSRYNVRYKFNGSFSFDYANDKVEASESSKAVSGTNYNLNWTHAQDPKSNPGSTLSAQVSFQSSGYSQLNGTLDDYVNSQTNSSINYAKTWTGTPFSFNTSFRQSMNKQDSSMEISFPGFNFAVSNIYPFKRKNSVGQQRWYEKISFRYNTTFSNSAKFKEDELFGSGMFDNMKMGMKHEIPFETSFNLFKFINVSPNISYNEKWYFDKIDRQWDPTSNTVVTDTISGFNRLYEYNASISASTTLYGMFNFKKGSKVQAIRHMVTPSLSFNYSPDFGKPSYGYYKHVQTNADGTTQQYSPYETGLFGVPASGEQASIGLSIGNNLEMKVRSDSDSTGFKKVSIFKSLNLSTSYNLAADSLHLAPIAISATTTLFKDLGVNFNMAWDLYKYNNKGIRTNDFAWANGSAGRITSVNLTFGYSFRSVLGYSDAGTDTGSLDNNIDDPLQGSGFMGQSDPTQRQALNAMSKTQYYNFSIPWNLTFNYSFSYQNATGPNSRVSQFVTFNGGLSLTPKWAVTFSSGVDLAKMQLNPTSIGIVRDLHCWQMSFSWIPFGFRKSWSFNINVKSSVLQDLKFKKSSSLYDNYYD